MAHKLMIEFYQAYEVNAPVATILACHGGDNPSSAATTLSDYFDRLSKLKQPRYADAGLLAARFIAWEGARSSKEDPIDFLDVSLEPNSGSYDYQTARVYAQEPRPHVYLVPDDYTLPSELAEAAFILRQITVGPPHALSAHERSI